MGDWFAATAVREGPHVGWIGLEFREKRWSLAPVPRDLYVGTPGIALFLAYLAAVTGDARAEELARATVDTLLESDARAASEASDAPAEPPFIGLMQGTGGVLYVLAHLAALWRDARLLAAAEREIEAIDARLEVDEDLDLVAGAAGALAGLLAAHRAGASPRALAVAHRCGEHLLARSRERGAGICWLTRLVPDRPQTGCAHGASGIALPLIALGAEACDRRFTRAGLAAFAWEREAFWPELYRWLGGSATAPAAPAPTASGVAASSSVAMSWCYGAPGIGLARLAALEGLDPAAPERAALEEEVAEALRLTVERGFGHNHCLCHGDLGNLELLLSARERPASSAPDRRGDRRLDRQLRRRAQQVLASIARDGWCCGTRGAVESPGLMNGVAGIGYGLLRLADPERVPSVLALAPPAGRGAPARSGAA